MTSRSMPESPSGWTLTVLEFFRSDPVISLNRAFPPTHAIVRAVSSGPVANVAVVEVELIDQPPPPPRVRYSGAFEHSAFERANEDASDELPWFPFDAALSLEANVERLVVHVGDCVVLFGGKETAPLAAEEIHIGVAMRSTASAGDPREAVRQRAARNAPPPPPPEPPPPPSHPAQPAPPSRPTPSARRPSVNPPRSSRPSAPAATRKSAPPRPKRRSSIPAPPPEPPPPPEIPGLSAATRPKPSIPDDAPTRRGSAGSKSVPPPLPPEPPPPEPPISRSLKGRE